MVNSLIIERNALIPQKKASKKTLLDKTPPALSGKPLKQAQFLTPIGRAQHAPVFPPTPVGFRSPHFHQAVAEDFAAVNAPIIEHCTARCFVENIGTTFSGAWR